MPQKRTKKVGVIGLRISKLASNPQSTLMGNPVRSWALFSNLQKYGFETELFIDASAPIDQNVAEEFGARFVRDPSEFLSRVKSEYEALIICGTRIQTTLEQHPWLVQADKCPIFLGQCYHNVDTPIPAPLADNIVGATFVTPRYVHRWASQHPETRVGLMTTGEVGKPSDATVANGDAVFMGHIHSHAILKKMTEVAAIDPNRKFHFVTSRVRVPQSNPADYVAFANMATDEERDAAFTNILDQIGAERPSNLLYHYLPPGEEEDLLNQASVGLDFSWNEQWFLDNSKVPNYLSFGLNVVTQLPAPSYRFVHKFNAGSVLPFSADAFAWRDAIQEAGELSINRKNELRRAARDYFAWDNAAFDIASVMLDYFEQAQS